MVDMVKTHSTIIVESQASFFEETSKFLAEPKSSLMKTLTLERDSGCVSKTLFVCHIPSLDKTADIFPKARSPTRFESFSHTLSLRGAIRE